MEIAASRNRLGQSTLSDWTRAQQACFFAHSVTLLTPAGGRDNDVMDGRRRRDEPFAYRLVNDLLLPDRHEVQ